MHNLDGDVVFASVHASVYAPSSLHTTFSYFVEWFTQMAATIVKHRQVGVMS
jgi:hypothetical protein